MDRNDRSVLEKLILKRSSGLRPTELELACCDGQGQSVELSAMFDLAKELQNLIYRCGEMVLGLDYRRSGQARLSIRERLRVVVQRPRSNRAFSLRIVLGDLDSLPFVENEQFRRKVVGRMVDILNGSKQVWGDLTKEGYVEGVARLVTRIRKLASEFGEAIILVAEKGIVKLV